MQPIEKQIINILSDRFTPEDLAIAVSMNLKSDLGFDSLDVMELIVVLEAHFNIFISDQQAGQIQTVDDIIKLIHEKMYR
ncbi:Acyl carrier protein [compost metagenome]